MSPPAFEDENANAAPAHKISNVTASGSTPTTNLALEEIQLAHVSSRISAAADAAQVEDGDEVERGKFRVVAIFTALAVGSDSKKKTKPETDVPSSACSSQRSTRRLCRPSSRPSWPTCTRPLAMSGSEARICWPTPQGRTSGSICPTSGAASRFFWARQRSSSSRRSSAPRQST